MAIMKVRNYHRGHIEEVYVSLENISHMKKVYGGKLTRYGDIVDAWEIYLLDGDRFWVEKETGEEIVRLLGEVQAPEPKPVEPPVEEVKPE
jgi:hypothetical protein